MELLSALEDHKAAVTTNDKQTTIEYILSSEAYGTLAEEQGNKELAAEFFFINGFLRGELGDKEGAFLAYRHCLALGFIKAGVLFNLGNCARELFLPKDALNYYLQALEIEPDRGDVIANMALAYEDIGDLENAERCFRIGAERYSTHPDAVCNLSYSLLRQEKFKEGWRYYEMRKKTVPHPLLEPTWHPGSDIQGKKILAVVEQGYGDIIMFGGLLNELTQRAATIDLCCDANMEKLLSRSLPNINVSQTFYPDRLDSFDHILGLGSLGFLCRNVEPDEFKPVAPYLIPCEAKIDEVSMFLDSLPEGINIGLTWKGGADHRNKSRRCIPLEELYGFLELKGVNWINLQHHCGRDELKAIKDNTGIPIYDPIDATNDIEGVAALMHCLDHVVTVQQTVVHFAGAQGVPAEVMIPAIPEWRYGVRSSKMLWWQSVCLHRQEELGCWTQPLNSVKEKLIALYNLSQ